jgi:ABC-type multidrug transport system ATPase subunit
LDDPFAAVDLPTARHLIDNVLNGILQGRTVVLVTHNKTALSVCDQIYSMENGRLLEGIDHGEDPSDFIQEKETESNRISDVYNSQNTDYDSMMDADTTIRKEEVFLKNEEKLESEDIKSHIYDIKSRATVTEDRVEGSVHTSTWLAYARASGG